MTIEWIGASKMVYMPFSEDAETKALKGRLEQQRARLLEIMHECGADYYEIGLIREHGDADRTLIEAWLVAMFADDEERNISEFDRDLETDEGSLLVHVVNWPDYWDAHIEAEMALDAAGPSPKYVLDWGKWTEVVRNDPELSQLSREAQLRAIRALGFGQIKIPIQYRGSPGEDD